MPITDTLKYY